MVDVAERAANIGGNQVKQGRRRGGKAANAEVALQHQNGDVDAAQQVLKVVADAGGLGIAAVELVVDGAELFVGGLNLFLSGLELFVGAL